MVPPPRWLPARVVEAGARHEHLQVAEGSHLALWLQASFVVALVVLFLRRWLPARYCGGQARHRKMLPSGPARSV